MCIAASGGELNSRGGWVMVCFFAFSDFLYCNMLFLCYHSGLGDWVFRVLWMGGIGWLLGHFCFVLFCSSAFASVRLLCDIVL